MRHAVQFSIDTVSHQILTKGKQHLTLCKLIRNIFHQLLHADACFFYIRNFDTDCRFSGNWCLNANILGSKCHFDIVLKVADFIDPDTEIRLNFEFCDRRSDMGSHKGSLDTKLIQNFNQLPSGVICRTHIRC